jgi:predicted nucleotidyltransferase
MNQKDFLNKIKARVLKEDANASLILFGSRARGDYRADSNWDVLVLTSNEMDFKSERKLRDDIYEVELEFMQPVSTIIVEKDKWESMAITPLYENVAVQGKVL